MFSRYQPKSYVTCHVIYDNNNNNTNVHAILWHDNNDTNVKYLFQRKLSPALSVSPPVPSRSLLQER